MSVFGTTGSSETQLLWLPCFSVNCRLHVETKDYVIHVNICKLADLCIHSSPSFLLLVLEP